VCPNPSTKNGARRSFENVSNAAITTAGRFDLPEILIAGENEIAVIARPAVTAYFQFRGRRAPVPSGRGSGTDWRPSADAFKAGGTVVRPRHSSPPFFSTAGRRFYRPPSLQTTTRTHSLLA